MCHAKTKDNGYQQTNIECAQKERAIETMKMEASLAIVKVLIT